MIKNKLCKLILTITLISAFLWQEIAQASPEVSSLRPRAVNERSVSLKGTSPVVSEASAMSSVLRPQAAGEKTSQEPPAILEKFANSLPADERMVFYNDLTRYMASVLDGRVVAINIEGEPAYARFKYNVALSEQLLELYPCDRDGNIPQSILDEFAVLKTGIHEMTKSTGLFGLISFRFFNDNGKAGLEIHTIQPSKGYRNLRRDKKDLVTKCRNWTAASAKEVFIMARRLGATNFYATSDAACNFPSEVSYGNRREYYRRPYEGFKKTLVKGFPLFLVDKVWKFESIYPEIKGDVTYQTLLDIYLNGAILEIFHQFIVYEHATIKKSAKKILGLQGISLSFIDSYLANLVREGADTEESLRVKILLEARKRLIAAQTSMWKRPIQFIANLIRSDPKRGLQEAIDNSVLRPRAVNERSVSPKGTSPVVLKNH